MCVLPSIPAAIVAGAVGMPLLAYGFKFIEKASASQWLVLPLVIGIFFVPVLVSTVDLKYLVKRWRESGLFSMSTKQGDFRLFYIPAWSRMLVWVISGVVSALLLKTLGFEL